VVAACRLVVFTMCLVLSNVRLGALGLILPVLHGLYGVGGGGGGGTAVAGAFSVALGLGGGEGAAACINRNAEKAVVELEEHAVRN